MAVDNYIKCINQQPNLCLLGFLQPALNLQTRPTTLIDQNDQYFSDKPQLQVGCLGGRMASMFDNRSWGVSSVLAHLFRAARFLTTWLKRCAIKTRSRRCGPRIQAARVCVSVTILHQMRLFERHDNEWLWTSFVIIEIFISWSFHEWRSPLLPIFSHPSRVGIRQCGNHGACIAFRRRSWWAEQTTFTLSCDHWHLPIHSSKTYDPRTWTRPGCRSLREFRSFHRHVWESSSPQST